MNTSAPDELDALVAAIWGSDAPARPLLLDPEMRAAQNRALSIAIKAYLQSYLDDMGDGPRAPRGIALHG